MRGRTRRKPKRTPKPKGAAPSAEFHRPRGSVAAMRRKGMGKPMNLRAAAGLAILLFAGCVTSGGPVRDANAQTTPLHEAAHRAMPRASASCLLAARTSTRAPRGGGYASAFRGAVGRCRGGPGAAGRGGRSERGRFRMQSNGHSLAPHGEHGDVHRAVPRLHQGVAGVRRPAARGMQILTPALQPPRLAFPKRECR